MNSRKNQPSETLAAPRANNKRNIDGLVELANLRDDPAAFERFARRWPDFSEILDRDPAPTDNMPLHGYPFGAPMTRMPAKLLTRFLLLWQMREALREIWRGDADKLTDVLLPTPEEAMMDHSEWASAWNPQLKLDWQRGEFVYISRSEFQEALYKLLRRSAFVKLCANSECPAPYFIAHKTTQRYCSESCAEVFQRAYKLRWWNEHGSERRRKRSLGKRGKR